MESLIYNTSFSKSVYNQLANAVGALLGQAYLINQYSAYSVRLMKRENVEQGINKVE